MNIMGENSCSLLLEKSSGLVVRCFLLISKENITEVKINFKCLSSLVFWFLIYPSSPQADRNRGSIWHQQKQQPKDSKGKHRKLQPALPRNVKA